jgi:hypothetical protein
MVSSAHRGHRKKKWSEPSVIPRSFPRLTSVDPDQGFPLLNVFIGLTEHVDYRSEGLFPPTVRFITDVG